MMRGRGLAEKIALESVEQVLQTQEGANALAKGIFVVNHAAPRQGYEDGTSRAGHAGC